MTDGIDFYEWNATVRALAASIEKLEEIVQVLVQPPWDIEVSLHSLERQLTELNGHLRRSAEEGFWLPHRGGPPYPGAAPRSPADTGVAPSVPSRPPRSRLRHFRSATQRLPKRWRTTPRTTRPTIPTWR